MSERSPQPSGQEGKNIFDKDEARFFRKHWLARNVTNLGVRAAFYIAILSTDWGRDFLRKYGLKETIFLAQSSAGLLEDSILSNGLYFPNDEGTSLSFKQAVAGRWVAYDFNRPAEFGKKYRGEKYQMRDGKLVAVFLDEVENKSENDFTPTNLSNMLDISYLFQLDFPSMESLLDKGFVRKSTYRHAYEQVVLLNKYRQFLALAGVIDNEVYTITPKGNGLVRLARDFGPKSKEPKTEKVLKQAFSY